MYVCTYPTDQDEEEGPKDKHGVKVFAFPTEDRQAQFKENGRLGEHGQEGKEKGGLLCRWGWVGGW